MPQTTKCRTSASLQMFRYGPRLSKLLNDHLHMKQRDQRDLHNFQRCLSPLRITQNDSRSVDLCLAGFYVPCTGNLQVSKHSSPDLHRSCGSSPVQSSMDMQTVSVRSHLLLFALRQSVLVLMDAAKRYEPDRLPRTSQAFTASPTSLSLRNCSSRQVAEVMLKLTVHKLFFFWNSEWCGAYN